MPKGGGATEARLIPLLVEKQSLDTDLEAGDGERLDTVSAIVGVLDVPARSCFFRVKLCYTLFEGDKVGFLLITRPLS